MGVVPAGGAGGEPAGASAVPAALRRPRPPGLPRAAAAGRSGSGRAMGDFVDLRAEPLTPDRFADLEALFSRKGCSFARGCWCMGYRVSGRIRPPEGVAERDHARALLRDLAGREPAPGLLGYDGAEPVGWVAVGPREGFARLARSPVMRPVDDRPVWSAVCFVVPSELRGRGVATTMLRAAVEHARASGAEALEGYPVDKPDRSQPQWMWHGARGMFDAAGFEEIARRKAHRPVVRLALT